MKHNHPKPAPGLRKNPNSLKTRLHLNHTPIKDEIEREPEKFHPVAIPNETDIAAELINAALKIVWFQSLIQEPTIL